MNPMVFSSNVPPSLEKKCRALEEVLSLHGPLALAYSGGVDSAFLAWFIRHAMKKELVAILAASSFISRKESRNARRVADEIGLSLEEILVEVLGVPSVLENSVERCYFCKKEVLSRIKKRAQELNCFVLLDGTNAEDHKGYRPGGKALRELEVLSPLALAGLEKAEIRELSRLAGLSTWKKPSESCLATRIPYDTPLTQELLARVEQAEALLWDLGCGQVRVRVHGDLARIEVDPEAFPLLLEAQTRRRIIESCRQSGFLHVCLDLAGFRSGSWDEPGISGS